MKSHKSDTNGIVIDPETIAGLNEILDFDPDIKIVISSSWVSRYSLDEIRETLERHRLISGRVIDTVAPDMEKAKAIELWVATHNPEFVCIVDDQWLFPLDNPLQECLVKISGFEGLKEKHLDIIANQFI